MVLARASLGAGAELCPLLLVWRREAPWSFGSLESPGVLCCPGLLRHLPAAGRSAVPALPTGQAAVPHLRVLLGLQGRTGSNFPAAHPARDAGSVPPSPFPISFPTQPTMPPDTRPVSSQAVPPSGQGKASALARALPHQYRPAAGHTLLLAFFPCPYPVFVAAERAAPGER